MENVLENHDTRLAKLVEISSNFDWSPDFEECLNQAVDLGLQLTAADYGYLYLSGELGNNLTLQVARNPSKPANQGANSLIQALVMQVINSGQGILSNKKESVWVDDSASSTSEQPPFVICVPLRVWQKVIGALYLEIDPIKHVFNWDDLHLVSALLNFVSNAVEKSELNHKIQAAKNDRNEFVSIVTHELRVPMTSIKGYADLMKAGMGGSLNDQQNRFLGIIQRNLKRMSILISALSNMNRLESGRFQLDISNFDLGQVVEAMVTQFDERLAAKNQTLAVEISDGLLPVQADSARIRQILENIIGNAHLYSPDGASIIIQVKNSPEAVTQGRFATVEVNDSGIGISETDQKLLFTPFFRSEDVNVRSEQGWGLGLVVVKLLIEAMGGMLDFRSTLGQGSSFCISVPLTN